MVGLNSSGAAAQAQPQVCAGAELSTLQVEEAPLLHPPSFLNITLIQTNLLLIVSTQEYTRVFIPP